MNHIVHAGIIYTDHPPFGVTSGDHAVSIMTKKLIKNGRPLALWNIWLCTVLSCYNQRSFGLFVCFFCGSVISVHHLWFTHTWPCISDFCAPHSICISDFCAQHSIYTYLTMHQWFLRTTLDLHIPGRFTHSGPCISDFQAPHTITHTHTWFPRKRHNVYILMQYKLKTHGFRIVPCFGPHIWNSLPQDLRHCSTLSSFKAKLKTFLFSQYFHPN